MRKDHRNTLGWRREESRHKPLSSCCVTKSGCEWLIILCLRSLGFTWRPLNSFTSNPLNHYTRTAIFPDLSYHWSCTGTAEPYNPTCYNLVYYEIDRLSKAVRIKERFSHTKELWYKSYFITKHMNEGRSLCAGQKMSTT